MGEKKNNKKEKYWKRREEEKRNRVRRFGGGGGLPSLASGETSRKTRDINDPRPPSSGPRRDSSLIKNTFLRGIRVFTYRNGYPQYSQIGSPEGNTTARTFRTCPNPPPAASPRSTVSK